MTFLRVIKDKSALEGTAFIELLPGRYSGNCWNDGSLFFDEETFGFFETVITKEAADYDHYAFTEISRPKWLRITARLKAFSSELRAVSTWQDLPVDIHFLFLGTESRFSENLEGNSRALAGVGTEIVRWAEQTLKEHDAITVLGM
jgi:hypothetical protein